MAESKSFSFTDALRNAHDRSDFSTQSHFSGHTSGGRDAGINVAGQYGHDAGEVNGGVGHSETPCNVEKNVFLSQFETHTFFKYSQKHVEAANVETRGGTLGGAIGGSAHESLCFNEEWSYTFDGRGHGNAAQSFVFVGGQHFGGICHGA